MTEKGSSVLDISRDQLTPGMQQYQDVKRAHPDCLVMLRMGDFFEMFYEDAQTASKELEITLTARGKGDKRAPLAGIPYHALETYLGKLVKKGYKVALVEQLEDPKKAKGLVKRGLVRIITPGTIIESSLLPEKENNYLLSLTCKEEEFAAAFCDISTGEFFTSNLENQNQLISELAHYNPSETILPESLLVNVELINKIKGSGSAINPLSDYYFSLEKAKQVLLSHFNLASLDSFGLEGQNVSACGALLQYMIDTQKNSLSHLKKISFSSSQQTMLLDSCTLRNLELLKNIRDGSSRGSLLSVLDKTITAMGARLLRQWIKKPLLNLQRIKQRSAAVGELISQVIALEEIRETLAAVYDLERLIGRVNYGTASPKDLLLLQASLLQLPPIKNKLKLFKGDLLTEISTLEVLDEIQELLKKALREDAPSTTREGGMIKTCYNTELDQLQDITHNSKKYLQKIEEEERQKTGISTLRIGFTSVFGYFIEITKKNVPLVPQNYIRKQTTANGERYITEELKLEEEKILGAQEKIFGLEYNLFQELLQKVAEKTTELQDTAAKIAVLDVLGSLAKVALENSYVQPHLSEEKILHIKNGRHPVVEQLQQPFVPNDIILDPQEMIILTGPNMAGKSCTMRQAALIVLMAQMGSFVPADSCVLGIVDRIFTRVGASDDLSSGQSTFMVEMNETSAILNSATENSLIILDEIGRGTSTFDGVSIAWSVAEHIYNKIKAKTLFATHYHVMNKLAEKFARIKNFNIAVREAKGEVIFLHKLVEGGTDQSYGIHVAQLAGLPSEVVARAREIQEILEKDDDMMRKIKAKRLEEQRILGEF